MLDIAFELIGEATSNSLLMFCFCNLIIVMILAGSSRPCSMDSQDSTFTSSMSYNMCNIASVNLDSGDDEEIIVAGTSYAKDESLIDASSVSDEDEDRESIHCCDYDDVEYDVEDDDDDDEDEEEEESRETEVEEEEGDDDLRRRAEEFIAKINNEWRHEKLKALNLVY